MVKKGNTMIQHILFVVYNRGFIKSCIKHYVVIEPDGVNTMKKLKRAKEYCVFVMLMFFSMMSLFTSGCSENGPTTMDSSNPSNPEIVINGGEAYATSQSVELTLSCDTGNSIVDMKISNNTDFEGALWEPYTPTKTWPLSDGFGTKTVYVQFVDEYDNYSETAVASIEYIDAVTLKVSPATATMSVDETVDVDILAVDAGKFISTNFMLHFDSSIVEVINIVTSGSGFLLSDAGANVVTATNDYDNDAGRVTIGVLGQKSGFAGAHGDGIIARITFRGKTAGNSPITFGMSSDYDLATYRYADNEQGFENYPTLFYNGTVTVQ